MHSSRSARSTLLSFIGWLTIITSTCSADPILQKIFYAGYYTGVYAKTPGQPDAQQLAPGQVYGLAVDPGDSKMYYTITGDAPGKASVMRANLDGSNMETLHSGLDFPQGVALDGAGKVYWADSYRGVIQRANLDGSGIQTVYSGPAVAVAIDPTHGMMYWTEFNNNRIGVAQVDGSNPHFIVSQGLNHPRMIELDTVNQRVYWTESDGKKIQRSNLDGSNVQLVYNTDTYETGGLAVDASAGVLYWQQYGSIAGLLRANLDGSNVQLESNIGISSSSGEIALLFVPEPAGAAVLAFLVLLNSRRRTGCA